MKWPFFDRLCKSVNPWNSHAGLVQEANNIQKRAGCHWCYLSKYHQIVVWNQCSLSFHSSPNAHATGGSRHRRSQVTLTATLACLLVLRSFPRIFEEKRDCSQSRFCLLSHTDCEGKISYRNSNRNRREKGGMELSSHIYLEVGDIPT